MNTHKFSKSHRKEVGSFMVIVLAITALCLFTVSHAWADIKIGFHAPLTGFAAADGKSAKVAAEMAVDAINAKGGVLGQNLVLVVYDDQAKADQAVPIANKLIGQDKVKFVVSGSYSGPTRAAANIFQNASIPYMVAYAVHPDITRAGDYVFRGVHLGPPQGKAGAYFTGKTLGIKKVSMIIMNNDYGVSTAEGFKEAAAEFGINIVNEYTYTLKDRQFGSIVASVKADRPDGIFITAYFFTAGPLTAQIRAAGLKIPIIGSQAFDAQKFLDIAGKAAEGVYNVGGLDRETDNPEVQKFMVEFKKRAGYPAESVGATTYSAVEIMADAIKRAGSTDQKKVRDALAATKNFPHFSGMLTEFNDLGEINMALNVNIVKGGTFKHFSYVEDLELLKPPSK